MAFNFNGNTPKNIELNIPSLLQQGLNVARLVFNGVVVWLQKILTTITGIPPLTLNNSTGEDLINYKVYGNSKQESKNEFDIQKAIYKLICLRNIVSKEVKKLLIATGTACPITDTAVTRAPQSITQALFTEICGIARTGWHWWVAVVL